MSPTTPMISSVGRPPAVIRWPTTASNGIPGNAVRAKLALTIARDGARSSSRASKVRPASTGISSAAKNIAADSAVLDVETISRGDRLSQLGDR